MVYRNSLGQSEAQVAISHEKVEGLTQAVKNAESETMQLRKERDQLQARIAKAQEGERRARDEAAELRGQLKAGDDTGKK